MTALADKLLLIDRLEERRREQARTSLDDYCKYIQIPGVPMLGDSCPDGDDCDDPNCKQHEVSSAFYPDSVVPAKHHRLINATLEKVARREIDPDTGHQFSRVMVFMPPGSAKSSYGSVTFPTWYMGGWPGKNIITTSYASGLAKKFGRKCRAITGSDEYQQLFGAALLSDNRAVNDWAITNGSTFMCGGILSGITGNRADGLVIDDPIKGREDADSQTIRDKTWEAYLTDLRTRLKPGAWILLIQTRWHEDDLSGRILPETWDGESGWVISRDGEPWYVICLPAEARHACDPLGRAPGEWLWTEWFSEEHWQREKRIQGSRNWSALYQQSPKPSEGGLIQRAWVERYKTLPSEFLRVVISFDTAYKDKDINDPSVATVWGETRQGFYLLSVWRDRVKYPDLKRIVVSMCLQWEPDAVLIEDKASGQSLIQELREGVRVGAELVTPPVVAIDTEGQSKIDRLVAVSSMFEAGQVYLPEAAPWLVDYESELFGVPLVATWDQADSTSQFLKWARRSRVLLQHHSSGAIRAGLHQGTSLADDDDGVSLGLGSDNDFGGFI